MGKRDTWEDTSGVNEQKVNREGSEGEEREVNGGGMGGEMVKGREG